MFTESSGGCGLLLTDGSPLVRHALRFIKPLRHCVYRELPGVWLIAHRRKPFSQTRPEVCKALAPFCLQRAPRGVAYLLTDKPVLPYHRCSATEMLRPVPKLERCNYTREAQSQSTSKILPRVFNNFLLW